MSLITSVHSHTKAFYLQRLGKKVAIFQRDFLRFCDCLNEDTTYNFHDFHAADIVR